VAASEAAGSAATTEGGTATGIQEPNTFRGIQDSVRTIYAATAASKRSYSAGRDGEGRYRGRCCGEKVTAILIVNSSIKFELNARAA
jgi:hypothetical protein